MTKTNRALNLPFCRPSILWPGLIFQDENVFLSGTYSHINTLKVFKSVRLRISIFIDYDISSSEERGSRGSMISVRWIEGVKVGSNEVHLYLRRDDRREVWLV